MKSNLRLAQVNAFLDCACMIQSRHHVQFIGRLLGKFSVNFKFLTKIQLQSVLLGKYSATQFDPRVGLIYLVCRVNSGNITVAKKPENLSFEDALSELERIVAELEQGDVSLDDALKQFERGINLVRNSQSKLEQAQQKVAILLNQNENAALSPFVVEGE